MTTTRIKPDPNAPLIYPVYCSILSPTNSGEMWCPLFAADMHTLHSDPNFEGQNIYFHLNHPIKFVYTIAVLVDVQIFNNVYTKRIALFLDDSSGEAIEAVFKLPPTPQIENGKPPESNVPPPEQMKEADFPQFDFVNLDKNIGKTVKIKGILHQHWGGKMQINIRRYSLVEDSNEEVRFWGKIAQFKSKVWGKPWVLSDEQVNSCREKREKAERVKEKREMRSRTTVSKTSLRRKVLQDKQVGNGNAKITRDQQADENWKCPSVTCGKNNPVNKSRCSCGLSRDLFKPGNKPKTVNPSIQAQTGEGSKPQLHKIPTTSIINQAQTDQHIEPKFQVKPGDWTCPSCGKNVYRRLPKCFNCDTLKPEQEVPNQVSKTVQGTKIQSLPGDWNCPSCLEANHASSKKCYRCKTDRPPFEIKVQPRPGDWDCPSCGNHNFSKDLVCYEAGCLVPHPKPEKRIQSIVLPQPQSNVRPQPQDWTCPTCKNRLFASKKICNWNGCKTERPR